MNIGRIYNNNDGRNFSYVVDNGKSAYVIDPYRSQLVINYLEEKGLKLEAIINTHDHHDHTHGNYDLIDYTDNCCQVVAHPESTIDEAPEQLRDGSFLDLCCEKELIRVVYTPGHTMSHLSLFFFDPQRGGKSRAVFCGDTLFTAGVGNCHNGGDVTTLYHTLKKYFYCLPSSTKIYPGHEYWHNNLNFTLSLEDDNQKARDILSRLNDDPAQALVSSIAIEREVNPFFRLDRHRLADESELDTFIRLRAMRDKWQ